MEYRAAGLQVAGATMVGAALAGCESGEQAVQPTAAPGVPTPSTTTRKLSGDLKILLWSHFVPAHDEWFDPFAQEWGKQVGVNVTVDHINQAEIPARTAAEIQAKQGHGLIQYIATFSQFEPSVVDLKDVVQEAEKRHGKMLDVVRKSSFNPNTNKYYAYAPAWAPDPGDYRKSMWEKVGLPQGPATWDDLLRGGAEIKKAQGIQMGIGMSLRRSTPTWLDVPCCGHSAARFRTRTRRLSSTRRRPWRRSSS
ncbi:MAG TPA: hypothetical protein VHR39_22380 [Propionibacteriaceae bacterium]|jgi:multiple sugar transport system substrate-binding protein|nr:hypothetical protein [Propionibacteriaceae bacterium]